MGLIYLDSCIVIYAFEDEGKRGARVRELIGSDPAREFAVSPLVKLECLVGPMQDANIVLQRYYEQGLAQFRSLSLTEEVFLTGAELRARFGLRTPDALHLAAAMTHRCDELWTNDARLAEAGDKFAVNVLAGAR